MLKIGGIQISRPKLPPQAVWQSKNMSAEKILIFIAILLTISTILNILIYLETGKIKNLIIGTLEELSNHHTNINSSIEKLSTQTLSGNQQTQRNLENLKREIANQKEETIGRLSNQLSLNSQQIQTDIENLKGEIINQKEEVIERLSNQISSNSQQTQKDLENLRKEITDLKEETIEKLSNQISLNKQQIQENLKELKDEIINQKKEISSISEKADENNRKTEHIIKLLKEAITEEDLK